MDNVEAMIALRNSEAASRARDMEEERSRGFGDFSLGGFKDQASNFVEQLSDLIPDEVKDWGGEISTDFEDLDLPFVGSLGGDDEREQENARERSVDDPGLDF